MAVNCCSIVELRDYTLHPGARDVLIDLFDRELVDTQEAVGIHVIGQFRDLDRPDHFVWLRGFADMQSRARSLASFYGGPVWAAHRDAANATMIDSDNVLLLRDARDGSGFEHPAAARPTTGAAAAGAYVAVVSSRSGDVVTPSDAVLVAEFVSETAENTFPTLPVREGEDVLVRVFRVDSVEQIDVEQGSNSTVMRLVPTSRSRLR